MEAPRAPFDTRLVRLRKERAKTMSMFLHARAADDLAERLEAIPRRFDCVLALGASKLFMEAVVARPALAERIGRMVRRDVHAIEPEDIDPSAGPYNLIVAPLALHWTNDLPGVFATMLRALAPDGLMLASMLGGDTLMQLRLALLEAEADITGGAAARVSPFVQLQDLAGLLQRAGFALPAADRDVVNVSYADALALVLDLRAMGETNALTERAPALRRAVFARASVIYAQRFAAPNGRINATFKILTATGWAPHASQQQPLKPGSAKARLADALGVKERSAGEKPDES